MRETPIHDFNKLKSALTNLGFTIGEAKPYRPLDIADVDLSNIQSGEVEITDEGIFYINPDTGTKQQIFLYKKAVFLEYRGVRKKPSMHLTNCEAIQDWGQNQYRRANTGSVIVWDKSSHREVEVSGLPLCSYCRRKMFLKESSINFNYSHLTVYNTRYSACIIDSYLFKFLLYETHKIFNKFLIIKYFI